MITNRRLPPSLSIGILAVLLAACGSSGSASSAPSPSIDHSAHSFAPAPSIGGSAAPAPSGGTDGVPDEMVTSVIEQAAEGAGVKVSEVTLVSAESVTWSDGSLGCPEPGQVYTQALVPGYQVVVEIEGDQLAFHAGRDGQFRYCDNPQPPAAGDR